MDSLLVEAQQPQEFAVDCKRRKVTTDDRKFAVGWSAIFIGLAGSWQYGFSVGSVNAAYLPIKEAIQHNYQDRWSRNVSEEFADGIFVISSASFPVGGIFGSLLVGVMARRFKILRALAVGHVSTILISLAFSLSYFLRSPEVLIICRICIGITAAAVTGLSVIYITGVSPQHLRGIYGSTLAIGISVGLTLSNAFGLPQLLGTARYWPIFLALTGVPSVFYILLIRTFVDPKRKSPSLSSSNGIQIGSLLPDGENVAPVQLTLIQVLRNRLLRRPLTCAIVVCAAQQLSGLNGVSFNMNSLYLKAGVSSDIVPYLSIGVSASIVIMNSFSAKLTGRYGRKPLLMVGYFIIGISMLVLAVCTIVSHLNIVFIYLAIVASGGFWVGFCMAPGPLTFVVIGEFFELPSRAASVMISTIALWFTFALVVFAMPYMLNYMGGYSFLPFSFFSLLMVLFIHYYIPETKNKTFGDIQRAFQVNSEARPANA